MQVLTEIDAWDEPNLALASACLKHRHPAQHAFVCEDLKPARGAGSVLVVKRFLDRLDALESGADRVATRDADHAALATLAQRGIDADERARVRGLLSKVESLADDEGDGSDEADADAPALTEGDMSAALRELRAYYEEWSAVARLVIKRRDHLIRLGLAQRKRAATPADPPSGSDATGGDPQPPT